MFHNKAWPLISAPHESHGCYWHNSNITSWLTRSKDRNRERKNKGLSPNPFNICPEMHLPYQHTHTQNVQKSFTISPQKHVAWCNGTICLLAGSARLLQSLVTNTEESTWLDDIHTGESGHLPMVLCNVNHLVSHTAIPSRGIILSIHWGLTSTILLLLLYSIFTQAISQAKYHSSHKYVSCVPWFLDTIFPFSLSLTCHLLHISFQPILFFPFAWNGNLRCELSGLQQE